MRVIKQDNYDKLISVSEILNLCLIMNPTVIFLWFIRRFLIYRLMQVDNLTHRFMLDRYDEMCQLGGGLAIKYTEPAPISTNSRPGPYGPDYTASNEKSGKPSASRDRIDFNRS